MPRVDRGLRAVAWVWLALFLCGFSMLTADSTLWVHVVVVGTLLTHASLIFTALVAWRAGAKHAKFFLLSFGIFLLGSSPQAYHWLRAIPLGTVGYPLLLGSALEMMLLSFAIADRFARLERGRHAAELAEEQARLESLRYQLNPHFLFNALNSIYGLVLPHSAPAADLVRRLADFCRDTLTRPSGQWQPLGDELAMIRNYLGIEQARWRDRLVLEFDLDPAADAFAVPPFLLLPLIDNAIKHGAATSPDRLTVRLAVRRESDGTIQLTITNSGAWAPGGAPAQHSTGVGLENIRARLQHAFGGAHSLTTHAAEGWVTLRLRLPAHPAGSVRTSAS
jgi:sensor histidine kinase YesM